jgi:hypothetical protein
MWRKTLFVVVGLLGIVVGLAASRLMPEDPSRHRDVRVDALAARDDSPGADAPARFDALALTQDAQQSESAGRHRTERTDARSREIGVDTANQTSSPVQSPKPDVRIALTPEQQQRYADLSQRIESATYGGFTMRDLQSQMVDMPREYQAQLLAKVVDQVNSGKLDPRRFVEGSH